SVCVWWCWRVQDKVEAAAAAAEEEGDVGGEEVEALPEPPDDAGPVAWPMPEFCPLTIDGLVKESFMEALRKDAAEQALRDAEAVEAARSPESRPSSSKRQRAATASPQQQQQPSSSSSSSSRSPYRNILQVFQQCKQDVT
ncbi:Os06g0208200, partial [Oryza sativa Japonica Group]